MSEPTQDLPPYLRRRLAALGGVAAVLLVLGWAVTGFFEDTSPSTASTLSTDARRSRTPTTEDLPLPAYPALSSSPPSSSSPSVSAQPSTAPAAPAPSGTSAASAVPSSAALTAPVPAGATVPTPQPQQPQPTLAAPPLPALVQQAPPQPCPDSALRVLAETGAPEYRVGQRPALRLVLVNVGQAACTRDVSRRLRDLVVTSADGGTRLWSSSDCYSSAAHEERLLQPGERLTFAVNWAGRTSAPGCPRTRRAVPVGTYLVVGRIGQLVSAPATFRLG